MLRAWVLGAVALSTLPAAASDWVTLKGLDDMRVSVAIAEDPSKALSLGEAIEQGLFQDLSRTPRQPVHSVVTFWRVDLHTPIARDGETVWLRAVPPLIWDADLLTPEGGRLHGGLVYPHLQQGHPGFPTQFKVRLTHPATRLYLRLDTALPELTHVAVLSDEALGREVQRDTLRQGLFVGSAMLMLLLTLFNWRFTRNRIYRDFAFYIGSVSLFMLCFNGYMSVYFLVDHPEVVVRLALVSFVMAVSSSVWFSLSAFDLRNQMPRTATGLKYFLLVVIVITLPGMDLDHTSLVARVLWLTYLPVGLLLLVLSAHLAIKQRSWQAWLAFGSFLSFSIFEKAPLFSMVGVFPVTEWIADVAKIGFVFQMLLTHLYLLIHLGNQRELERKALAARVEAQAERAQHHSLLQFLSMFGHEVRTPLSIIDAATQSLEVMAGADAPHVQRRYQRIRKAVQRLNLLSREVLSRERIESGSWVAKPRPVALDSLLEDALAMHGITAPDLGSGECMRVAASIGGVPGGSLEVDATGGLPDLVADADMLEIALGNLIDNACKYADPASLVRLKLSTVGGADGQADFVVFEVLSQGPVLSPADLVHMFEKYWRGGESQGVVGAGLGLHLVRLIANAHGGSIRVHSLPMGWTCFSLSIPLRPPVALLPGVQP